MRRLFNRIRYIYQNEGLTALFKATLYQLRNLLPFELSTLFLLEHEYKFSDLDKMRLPSVDNIKFMIVSTEQELRELTTQGYDMSFINIHQVKHRLKNKAKISLIFVGSELAHFGWIAMNAEAQKVLSKYPFKINFVNGEAYIGDFWTNPKYRRMGFNAFGDYRREEYLLKNGVTKNKSIVLTDNVASLGAAAKHGTKIYAKASYLRIFGLKFWRETPISQET